MNKQIGDTVWPAVDRDLDDLEWQLRYADFSSMCDSEIRSLTLQAASVVAAYRSLIAASDTRRQEVIKGLKRCLKNASKEETQQKRETRKPAVNLYYVCKDRSGWSVIRRTACIRNANGNVYSTYSNRKDARKTAKWLNDHSS